MKNIYLLIILSASLLPPVSVSQTTRPGDISAQELIQRADMLEKQAETLMEEAELLMSESIDTEEETEAIEEITEDMEDQGETLRDRADEWQQSIDQAGADSSGKKDTDYTKQKNLISKMQSSADTLLVRAKKNYVQIRELNESSDRKRDLADKIYLKASQMEDTADKLEEKAEELEEEEEE
ncbi:MAG: hypothetical protein ACOCSE_03065 [Chitinivibrionales bacterium]